MALLTAEIRYASSPMGSDAIISLLGFGETKFPNPYNHTIYQESSGSTTNIRARRYAPNGLPGVARFNAGDKWLAEKKSSIPTRNGWIAVAKERTPDVPFSAISRVASLGAVSYRRRHFIESENENAIRVTVDNEIAFYKFDEPNVARRVGNDPVTIVEIKTPPRLISGVLGHVQRVVRQNSDRIADSKRSKTLKFGYGGR